MKMDAKSKREYAKGKLTEYLNSVRQEETETVSINGEPKIITKAEALARRLWLMALGGKEEFINDNGETVETIYKPDRKSAELIYAYLEGKPPVNKPNEKSDRQKPHGFTSDTKTRLSETLELDNESDKNNN